jgi:hypothetical protein
MHRKIAGRRIGIVLLPLALVALTGCPPRDKKPAGLPSVPPSRLTLDQAVAAVNTNVAGIAQSLASGNIRVNATFHDEEGKAHNFRDLRGVLRFFPPRYLYLRIGDIVEPSAVQLGSNDTSFWMAVKPKRNELWWGRWADLGPAETADLPLAPDMVLAAMGLARLPSAGEGLLGPVPQLDEDGYYKLLYLSSAGGKTWIQREYWLDPFLPHLPRAVIFREPGGMIQMIATLDRYERVGQSAVYIAREIRMSWPQTRDSLSMRINSLKFDPRFGPGSRAYQMEALTTIPESRWVRVGHEPRPAPATVPAAPAATGTAAPDGTPAAPTESPMTMPAPATDPAADEPPLTPDAAEPPVAAEAATTEPAAAEPAESAAPMELESSPE